MSVEFTMPRSFGAAVTVLIAAFPAVATGTVHWGPTINGLRMSVAVCSDALDRELRIIIQNVGESGVVLHLGVTQRCR